MAIQIETTDRSHASYAAAKSFLGNETHPTSTPSLDLPNQEPTANINQDQQLFVIIVTIMSTPVVVQGTAVSAPHSTGAQNNNHGGGGTHISPGTDDHPSDPPKTSCNDVVWAFLLYANVAAIAAVAVIYGPGSFSETDDSGFDYTGYVWAGLICAVISVLLSGVGLGVNMCCPETIIKVALIFTVVMSLVWAVFAFITGAWCKSFFVCSFGFGVRHFRACETRADNLHPYMIFYFADAYLGRTRLFINAVAGALGAVFFLIGVCYARAVWSRIPFAAVNMLTAATAIKKNLGIVFMAYVFTALLVGWIVLWSIAFSGVFNKTYVCDANNQCDVNYGFLFLLFVAFFFTQQVVQGCIHVMVAGTVATWWVAPEESGCCGKGICNSVIRTLTTSFGSICFGSLLVAIVQALRALANSAQSNGDGGIFVCIAECILACLASILEYFNKWAFIYVGKHCKKIVVCQNDSAVVVNPVSDHFLAGIVS